ncbi:hypothetical protein [Mesorhizobium sp. M7A.F.Ca.US.008.03.1.1]|uniref:hypothetical protein n=1 Tax=Mesorhizobium sp. M7A.F.Ca.US.008.03.1.1 TaxID=2496742 RepID=UPI000FCA268B|nr:hypothetical protein [Mesorhizobium sp. M7A.F.Ca.US.008.03.1.1]RUW60692.1 hypothetical protein EOA16_17510 [Mesorhizobium sp. M7A.F.Ca.US.008.03.1.1]
MRAIAFLAGVLVATPSSGSEQVVFHRTNFADATSVQFMVATDSAASGQDYDFEVGISLVETDANGSTKYVDPGRHQAQVRCANPAYVGIGMRKFPISALTGAGQSDWKEDLWKMYCAVPSS